MAEPAEEEVFGALWQRVQQLEQALAGAPSQARARALVTECRVELQRIEPRLGVPTQARLRWIGDRYPAVIVTDVIYVWAEATGQHELKASLWKEQERCPTSAEAALLRVHEYAAMSERPDVRTGRTRFDRYLPWLARELGRGHKKVMRAARRYTSTFPEADASDEQRAAARKIAAARDFDGLWMVHDDWPLAGPHASELREEISLYEGLAEEMTLVFRTITDWARAEEVDLGRLTFDDATRQALPWAHELKQARPMPQGDVVYRWPDGWTVQDLTTAEQLVAEGTVMHHCLDQYPESKLVARGGPVHIFSLRDPSGRPHATLEWLADGWITQARGVGNTIPSDPQILWRLLQLRHGSARLRGPWRPDRGYPPDLAQLPGYRGRFRRQRDDGSWEVVDVIESAGEAVVYDAEELSVHLRSMQVPGPLQRRGRTLSEAWSPRLAFHTESHLMWRDAVQLHWTRYVTTGTFLEARDGGPQDDLARGIWVATEQAPGLPLDNLAKLAAPRPDGSPEGTLAS